MKKHLSKALSLILCLCMLLPLCIFANAQEVTGANLEKDTNGNYEPNNCQWLTRSDNSKKTHMDKKKRAKEMVEVVHGRWVDAYGIRKSKCENCGVAFGRVMDGDCYYCPNCGAKMDGDGNG